MTDSSMYTSLFALVDSHLAKVSLQDNEENSNSALNGSPFNNFRNPNISTTSLEMQTCRLPSFGIGMGDSSIRNVLAEQVANMLKAKEEKEEEEEKLKLEEEMRRLKIEEEKNNMIDLTQAIQTPYRPDLLPRPKKETLSTSSSCESLFKFNFIDCDVKPDKILTTAPLLPCITDMSYILKKKIKKSKGSSFGKVVSSRQRRVAAPYLKEIIKTDIVQFDFSTPSPCDILKEKQRKPKMSCRFTFNLEEFWKSHE